MTTASFPATAQTTDGILAAAQQAAHENHNAEAARLFAQAIAVEPARRLEVLPDLADQLTYSGSAAQAIPLYEEALRAHTLSVGDERRVELGLGLAFSWDHRLRESLRTYDAVLAHNPADIDALLGHARVVSWENELTPALHEYEHILAIAPGNRDALDNIARVESWRGRQRDAERRARALLASDRNDVDASKTLAQAELWMGRPDIAQHDDDELRNLHPDDGTAKSLAGDIADTQRGRVSLSENVSTQSDGLLIHNEDAQFEQPVMDGLTSFGVRYQPITYVGQADGSASERRLGPFVRSRFSDWGEINGTVFEDDISSTGNPDHRLTLYDTYLTLWPNDTFRFDIGARKEVFDNLTSLGEGITAPAETISMDVTPDENTRFTLRGNVGNFSDGNRRAFEQVEFERTVLRQPRLAFGVRGTGYTFSEQLDNGYFDPPRYRSAELTTHLAGGVNGRFSYDVAGSYGREWVEDGGTRPSHTLHGGVSYAFSRALNVSAVYDDFDTRQQLSDSGFSRSIFGLRLETKW